VRVLCSLAPASKRSMTCSLLHWLTPLKINSMGHDRYLYQKDGRPSHVLFCAARSRYMISRMLLQLLLFYHYRICRYQKKITVRSCFSKSTKCTSGHKHVCGALSFSKPRAGKVMSVFLFSAQSFQNIQSEKYMSVFLSSAQNLTSSTQCLWCSFLIRI
jgi:hypothetical protein